ncbi:methyl-accepting chemotaxis protein [Zymobacter palmae]|uniref:Methyl-accepting chemotaxis protein n=1 Tax=Zymobacter palmae TaxID=33074 RepID=A0A348HBA1_9GAMM|nr:methyl-accepting chemotaxis protein [Zymobacter palmae]BBG28903.1 methyl-accepting chemotaxis protein [Zymobacter palmae]
MNASNMKISTRLISTFAILLALMIGLAGLTFVRMSSVESQTTNIAERRLPSTQLLGDLRSYALSLRLNELKYTYSMPLAEKQALEKSMQTTIDKFNVAIDQYKDMLDDDSKYLGERLDKSWDNISAFHAQIITMTHEGKSEEVDRLLLGKGSELRQTIEDVLTELTQRELTWSKEATIATRKDFSLSFHLLWAGCLLAVIFAAIASWFLIRYLLDAFRQAIAAARRIASGDLVNQVEGRELTNEVGQLLNAMDEMRSSLSFTVAAVRQNADGVAAGSEQISRGNADLSSRTEQQAAALEETASAMDELSATIKQNTDNAMNADRLAQDASKVANDGGDIVKRVVTRMHDINEGANRVVEVISLLDSIAFQTNLLALNASVEAARAGEQGRGFAVVASEVRNLAQRSAEASREIGGLITESVNSIRSGTELANEAGTTIEEVVSTVNNLKDIMGEISSASYEQNQGVTQVGTAVTQMDQTTQQNAALVEESAAAAASLYEQARKLQETVQVFRVQDA